MSVKHHLALGLFALVATIGVGCLSEAGQHHNAGVQLVNDGRWEEAIAEYDEAIRLDPRYARAYNNRGLVYSTLGEYQRAIQDHNEAIRLDPQLAEAYYPRGVAYGALGEYQRAIEDLDEAIRLDPQDAKAYNNRGRAYDDLGEHERAIQDHNEAIRLDPQLASAYNNRGLAYDGLGEHQRAIEDLTQQEAENTVIERDKTRAHYFRRFFGVDDPDKPESYHLVINTSDVAADYAVDLVVQAAKVVEAGKFRTADSVG